MAYGCGVEGATGGGGRIGGSSVREPGGGGGGIGDGGRADKGVFGTGRSMGSTLIQL